MSAIKSHLFDFFDQIESVLEDFPNLEVTLLAKSALVEGDPNEIDAFIAAVKEQNNPHVSVSHSMLFPDMVAITFKL